MMKTTLPKALTLALSLFCYSVSAHWLMLPEQSSLHFVSTKNQNISEVQKFTQLNGEFDADGKLQIDINLASIDSGIEIRDTRMREQLFIVDKFPLATLSAQLPKSVMDMAKGSSILVEVPAELSMMNITKTIPVQVQVTRKIDNGYVATSTRPILISATEFGLQGGVATLQKLAGLAGIGLTVPVNFNLVFKAH